MTTRTVELAIDDDVDAAYIELQPTADAQATTQIVVTDDRLAGTVVLDLDPNGRLLGVEFIGLQEMLDGAAGPVARRRPRKTKRVDP